MSERPAYQFYGRRQGRPLTGTQQRLVAEILPSLRLPETGIIKPSTLFSGEPKAITLEIGFGNGEHLLHRARMEPDTGFIGIEPYRNGVAKALVGIEHHQLKNIRLYDGDARDVLPRFAPASLDTIFVLFPDPWPKKRHLGRRFIQAETLARLAALLKPKGQLCLASDDAAYIHHMLCLAQREPALHWMAVCQADWQSPFMPAVTTAFHRKALAAGRPCVFLRFAAI